MMSLRSHMQQVARVALAAAAVALTLVGVRDASAWDRNDPRVKHESWSWNGTLAAGRTLEINGINGAVIAEPGSGDKVEVTADKAGRRDDPAKVQIKVVQDSDGLTICSVYPDQGSPCTDDHKWSWHMHDNDVEVEYHVKVPAGVHFRAKTVNGSVSAHALQGSVQAKTVNGAVDIETAQGGEAQTVNGSVKATVGRMSSTEGVKFSTVNGSITLSLPDDANAEIEGSTVNGGIHTDFPVTVSGEWGPRNMHGTIGKGGPRLELKTVNGSIALRRSGGKTVTKSL